MPPLLLRGLSLVNPTIRELLEMQYQFEEAFVVDSSKIAARLGISVTPLAAAIGGTLEAIDPRLHQPPRPGAPEWAGPAENEPDTFLESLSHCS